MLPSQLASCIQFLSLLLLLLLDLADQSTIKLSGGRIMEHDRAGLLDLVLSTISIGGVLLSLEKCMNERIFVRKRLGPKLIVYTYVALKAII